MSDLDSITKNEYTNDAPPAIIQVNNKEIYYNCSECSSLIEIISINENKNIIEFKCLNKESNHPKNIIMPLKEYLEKMKKYNNRKLNCEECEIHKKNNKYVSYCFNCNRHLCEECLKTRIHINHIKNNIIEIKPMNEELDIIKEVINYYKNNIKHLIKEKENKINELNKALNKNKKSENEKIEEKIKNNEKRREEELKSNNDKYLEDINNIIKRYKEEINIRKMKYINDNNKISNKYRLINGKDYTIHKFRINELDKIFNEEIKNLKYNEKIDNINNIKTINEIIYNTYKIYNNNYYNAININSILLSYIKNEYIKNKIMKSILNNKYEEIYEIIQRKMKDDNNMKKEKENNKKLQNEIMNEYDNKIENIEKDYENKLEKIYLQYKTNKEKIKNNYKLKIEITIPEYEKKKEINEVNSK